MNQAKNPTPFANYFGGKSGQGVYHNIINHIPPHRLFISLFAGNCGVFKHMRRPEWSIINDIDTDVIKEWTATGISLAGDVTLTSLDARIFLRDDINKPEYKRWHKHMFLYLDPPYLFLTRKGQQPIYKHEFGDVLDHTELLVWLKQLPEGVKAMISSYPNELYDTILSEWKTFDFVAQTRKGQVIERIYMNYELDGHLHDYSFIGGNFRERERHKRIITNWFRKLDEMEPLLRNKILQEYELQHRTKMR